MSQRLIERVEVVPDRLDLAGVDDLVPEPQEDVLDLAPDLRERMEMPAPQLRAGKRDVQGLVEPSCPIVLELCFAFRERGFEPLPDGVERHPRLTVAHSAQRLLQLALPPQVADASVVELFRRRGGGDCNRSFLHAFPPFAVQGRTTSNAPARGGSVAARVSPGPRQRAGAG